MIYDAFNRWEAVAASDTVNQPQGLFEGLYVGAAGNVVVVQQDDSTRTIPAVAGGYLRIRGKRVNSTSTTATGLFALYP